MTHPELACVPAPTHDLIVIGGGPAGQKAAIQGAKLGLSVALVERARQVGGACVYRGTIPSKTLRETALVLGQLRESAPLLLGTAACRIDSVALPELMRRLQGVSSPIR